MAKAITLKIWSTLVSLVTLLNTSVVSSAKTADFANSGTNNVTFGSSEIPALVLAKAPSEKIVLAARTCQLLCVNDISGIQMLS